MAALPDHIGDHPMIFALLEAFHRQLCYLCPSKTASQQNSDHSVITFAAQTGLVEHAEDPFALLRSQPVADPHTAMDEWHSVLSLARRSGGQRACDLFGLALVAHLYLAAAILDEGGLLAIGKWRGPRHPLRRYLGMAGARRGLRKTGGRVHRRRNPWTQLKEHLNVGGTMTLDDHSRLSWFLDPDIEFPNPGTATNAEPLLINTAGSLEYRPEAQVELKNLFLASDDVRTYTDIACMEAANETARRAVNCLLVGAGFAALPAQLWPLEEPAFLKPLQEIDRIRFGLGLPHHLASA